jgi:hypothetical protein
MARRRENYYRRLDVQLTYNEWSAIARAAHAVDDNVTKWVRAALVRSATRSDAVVRFHRQKMAGRDAMIVRLLVDYGLFLTRLIAHPSARACDPGLIDLAKKKISELTAAIKKVGEE